MKVDFYTSTELAICGKVDLIDFFSRVAFLADEVYCAETANSTTDSSVYGDCMKEVEMQELFEKSKRTWGTIVIVLAAFFAIFIGE